MDPAVLTHASSTMPTSRSGLIHTWFYHRICPLGLDFGVNDTHTGGTIARRSLTQQPRQKLWPLVHASRSKMAYRDLGEESGHWFCLVWMPAVGDADRRKRGTIISERV